MILRNIPEGATIAVVKRQALDKLNRVLNQPRFRAMGLGRAGFGFRLEDIFIRHGDPMVTPVAHLSKLPGP